MKTNLYYMPALSCCFYLRSTGVFCVLVVTLGYISIQNKHVVVFLVMGLEIPFSRRLGTNNKFSSWYGEVGNRYIQPYLVPFTSIDNFDKSEQDREI